MCIITLLIFFISIINFIDANFWSMIDTQWNPTISDSSIALCMNGQIRVVEETIEEWHKYVYNTIKPDVFIHTSTSVDWEKWYKYNRTGLVTAFRAVEPFFWVEKHMDELVLFKNNNSSNSDSTNDDINQIKSKTSTGTGTAAGSKTWRSLVPKSRKNKWSFYGALPHFNTNANWIQIIHMYGCYNLILKSEIRRGKPYKFVAVGRSDYIWMAPHPPLSLLSPSSVYIPANGNDYLGFTDMYIVGGRRHIMSLMSIAEDVATMTTRGKKWMLPKQVAGWVSAELKRKELLIDILHINVTRFANIGALVCNCTVRNGFICKDQFKGAHSGCRFRLTLQRGVKDLDKGYNDATWNAIMINQIGWNSTMFWDSSDIYHPILLMEPFGGKHYKGRVFYLKERQEIKENQQKEIERNKQREKKKVENNDNIN